MQLQTLTLINAPWTNSVQWQLHTSITWAYSCHVRRSTEFIYKHKPKQNTTTDNTFDTQHWPQFGTMHFINAAENTHHTALKCNKTVQMQQM